MYFKYWIVQEADPSATGVERIKLSDAEEAEKIENFDYEGSEGHVGIYHPGWDEVE